MAEVSAGDISLVRRDDQVSVNFLGEEFIAQLGIGLPVGGRWRWTFDRSLRLLEERVGTGRDRFGEYSCLALVYSMPGANGDDVPLIQQELRAYDPTTGPSRLLIETRALEDITGTCTEDSYYNTTYNSPVMLFHRDLNFLGYTWGLMGVETARDGGHFPEAITGRGIADIPSKLRLAGYSPREDLRTTSEKPFGPLVLYDDAGKTLVVSSFNHYLISPLRVIDTPSGMGVARGLHGSVDVLPRGTTTLTALVFGQGVVETMTKWGDWLLQAGGKRRAVPDDSPLLGGVGFWNCFGGYYTELFRQVDERVLKELAEYFQKENIPIRYFGLDLWYNYDQVGFARNYLPDPKKYPRGLGLLHRETGMPYLLHMSAFESPNDYIGEYEFAVERSSSYPTQREFYQELARDFKAQGAFGIWPDFLRTQLQNSRSLRSRIGSADRWFDDLAGTFGEQDMVMMMCMPTTGHYLASTRHQNIIAVRTHTDYLNHQRDQVEALRSSGRVRNFLPPQQSIRHNVLLSLLAHALGLWPSFDVFLTSSEHPEGFADPSVEVEALLRAMSGGVIAVGDQAGFIDSSIINKLCFPDGSTSRPDHPPFPVVSTLDSEVLAFYTTTSLGDLRWVYLALFNVSDGDAPYRLDIQELAGQREPVVYDHFSGVVLHTSELQGMLKPAEGHYYVIMPQVCGVHFLGFSDKYITVSGRQFAGIETSGHEYTVHLRLPGVSPRANDPAMRPRQTASSLRGSSSAPIRPAGSPYTVTVCTPAELEVEGDGAEILNVVRENTLLHVQFTARSEELSLNFRLVNDPASR